MEVKVEVKKEVKGDNCISFVPFNSLFNFPFNSLFNSN